MLFATELAEEPSAAAGGRLLEDALGAKPALHMGLRLGEASGAVLAIPLLKAGVAVLERTATLEEVLALGPGS
jgi:nicotinate-nucleotide--dimethylbenzimidazole phosphoribosyltransferase